MTTKELPSRPQPIGPAQGPHEGPILRQADGYVELSVFETGTPPRFRLYFFDTQFHPVAPPAADSIALLTERPGEIVQRFAFRQEDNFLESSTNIPEPHEFLARLELEGGRQQLVTLFTEEGHDHDHDHGHDHGDAEHGTHGGPVIAHAEGLVEISVFETGVPPRFRLYFLDNHAQPVAPLPAGSVSLTTVRPDGREQTFRFRQEAEFLEATSDLPEPHEFEARLGIEREDGRQLLVTPFTEEGHDHGSHGHSLNSHHHDHGGHGQAGTHGHEPHHGDHNHDHGSGILGWLRGTFAHSHDASDKVDSVMESSAKGIRALKISLVGLGITALLQVLVVFYSGSVALLADTIHNFADAATSIPLWIAFTLARRGANRRFTYGYGKTEDVAGVVIVGVIFFSACVAGYEAVLKFVSPEPMRHLGWVAAAALIGFIGNEAVAVFRIKVGREIGSAALIADGQHSRVDGFTSLSVLIGVLGAWLGFPLLDPLVGIGITIAILFIVKDAAVAVWHRLIDGIEPEILDEITHAPTHVAGVRAVRTVRARWIGHKVYSDVTIAVDPDLPLAVADAISRSVERSLRAHIRLLGEVVVRVTP